MIRRSHSANEWHRRNGFDEPLDPDPAPATVVTSTAHTKTRVRSKEEKPGGTAIFTQLSKVRRRSYSWLWPGRLPIGEPVMIFGECDVGKSMLCAWLAASVTVGGEWPDQPGECAPEGDVIFVQEEDSLDTTLRPRIEEAGGNPDRVHSLDHIEYPGDRIEDFSLSVHAADLERALISMPKVKLLVIDPISAYLGRIDGNDNMEVRRSLKPLARIARSRGIAVVMISHPNKGTTGNAKNLASGSGAFINAPRAAYLIAPDPDTPERRLLAAVKFNVGVKPLALAYGFDGMRIAWEPDPVPGVTADSILARHAYLMARTGKRGPAPNKRRSTADWLKRRLTSGPVLLADLIADGDVKGFSRSTINRALTDVKASSLTTDGVTFYQLGDLFANGHANGTAHET